MASLNFSALETYVSSFIAETTGVGEQDWIYLAVEKMSGGNLNFRYSCNGITGAANRLNMTPYSTFDQIGLWVQSGSGTNNEATPHAFDWFRVR